ncbi:hypothetical protein [Chenggangzhangella methanolivorans]|uniref:Uncharacterized protein n=1 Tax=Chenggangzhangella methanolivorans TaxID=1437009 RepID=A0A9E6RCT6_9HYPH|nr:hypothetical protein [Chenggangzhangella methanolivorans]QZN98401.1 hypothetical protein K6K41_14980 [Chenggangzhangella methanolivorans]
MADYFPVLSRAVAGLENNTPEARRAVYERARAAITRQLRAIEPPLSEDDIGREQSQLEEAIRRIETGAGAPASAAAAPAAPRAPAPPPRPSAPPPPANAAEARPSASTAPKPEPRREKPAPDAAADRPAQSRPSVRADGRPIIQSGAAARDQQGTKRSGPMVAIAALAVIAVGAGLFAARGQIAALFGGGTPSTQQTAERPQTSEPPAATSDEKASDRLTQDGAETPAPQAEPSAPAAQPEQDVARAPEPTAPPPSEAAPAAQPATPAQPAQEDAGQAGPLVAQRAVLYEEGPNQQSGEASQGTVTWRTESVSGGPDQALETALRGDIDIPGRKLRATLTIRRNADATLPASHTIEIQFTLPEDFPNAGISNVPGVLMKADEAARGAAVSGLSVRVTSGFFLIGLSNMDTERSVNEQLLRDRGWIDIPILYDNGRRAVLTLEKGTPGSQAFQEAFSAWRSASTSPAPPANP